MQLLSELTRGKRETGMQKKMAAEMKKQRTTSQAESRKARGMLIEQKKQRLEELPLERLSEALMGNLMQPGMRPEEMLMGAGSRRSDKGITSTPGIGDLLRMV